MELLDKKPTEPGPEISVHPVVTFFLSFFLSFLPLHKLCVLEGIYNCLCKFYLRMRKLSYVKLYKTCLYFPFPFFSSVLQSFFSFPASSLFGTQQQLTHPPVKSPTLPLRKMPVFQGVAPWHTIFTSSCVIPLWNSTTAHSPSSKELNPSSQEDARFSGRCTLA